MDFPDDILLSILYFLGTDKEGHRWTTYRLVCKTWDNLLQELHMSHPERFPFKVNISCCSDNVLRKFPCMTINLDDGGKLSNLPETHKGRIHWSVHPHTFLDGNARPIVAQKGKLITDITIKTSHLNYIHWTLFPNLKVLNVENNGERIIASYVWLSAIKTVPVINIDLDGFDADVVIMKIQDINKMMPESDVSERVHITIFCITERIVSVMEDVKLRPKQQLSVYDSCGMYVVCTGGLDQVHMNKCVPMFMY